MHSRARRRGCSRAREVLLPNSRTEHIYHTENSNMASRRDGVHRGSLSLITSAVFLSSLAWSPAAAVKEPVQFGPDGIPLGRPLVIAQGGARGPHPLYTLPSYTQALDDGVRTLECKVCITRDGVPVCCPGINLEYISDIKRYAANKMAGLYTSHLSLNDKEPQRDGWFIFNFTMDQLNHVHVLNDVRHQRLLVKGRRSEKWYFLPWSRLPTVAEFLDLVLDWAEKSPSVKPTGDSTSAAVRTLENIQGKDFTPINMRPQWDIRLILEPLYAEFMYNELHLEPDKIILEVLSQYRLVPTQRPENETESTWEPPRVAVHVQSKEPKLLQLIHEQAPLLPLIQVLDVDWDQPDSAFPIVPVSDNLEEWRNACWDSIRSYAWAVSVSKDLLLPRNGTNYLAVPPRTDDMPPGGVTMLQARARNLTVLCWSFCDESMWPMAYDFNADPYAEHDAFIEGVGVDGFFTSCPAASRRYLESRICLQLLAAGQKPISSEALGWTEFLVMVFMVIVAVLPMAAGLMYAIYKWRESEQFRQWQEFNFGGLANKKTEDSAFMMAVMGVSERDKEKVPLRKEEWDGDGPPDKSKKAKEKVDKGDKTNLLSGGEDSSSGSVQSSGTWRMRRGAEWNSDDVWS